MSERPDSWILLQIEDGQVFFDDAGGKWYTKKRLEYILNGGDIDVEIEMHEGVQARIKNKDLLSVFQVKLVGVSFVVEEGGWNLDYGYDFPSAHIECDGVEIIELEDTTDE